MGSVAEGIKVLESAVVFFSIIKLLNMSSRQVKD